MCMTHRWKTAEGGSIHAHQEEEKTSSGQVDGGQRTWVGLRMTPLHLEGQSEPDPELPTTSDAKRVHENNLEHIRNKSYFKHVNYEEKPLGFGKIHFPTHNFKET